MAASDPTPRHELTKLLEDPATYLDAADPGIRRVAVAASIGDRRVSGRLMTMLGGDPDPMVRRECAEILGLMPIDDPAPLEAALNDASAEVREAAATAIGEVAAEDSVPLLVEHAGNESEDNLVREAAVAALGAIGDPSAVQTLLDLLSGGPPQVRRRCVAALSVFDGDNVEAALRAAATDRNPMVREAAEMVVGRTVED
jgi:HEAT repeat protein